MSDPQSLGDRGRPPFTRRTAVAGDWSAGQGILVALKDQIESEEVAATLRARGFRTTVGAPEVGLEFWEYRLVLIDDVEFLFLLDLVRGYDPTNDLDQVNSKFAALVEGDEEEQAAWSNGANLVFQRPFDPSLLAT